jgi:hypothetical protein
MAPFAVGEGGVEVEERAGWIASAAEVFFGDFGKVGLRFPGVGGTGGVFWSGDGAEDVVATSVDVLGLGVLSPDFLLFRFFKARTCRQ